MEPTREEELHWLALTLVPGLGTRRAALLIERFKSPLAIFRASRSELEGAGLSGSVAQSIASGCTFEDAAEQQQRMLDAGARLVPMTHPCYPRPLREIYDPPPVLFARGNTALLATHGVGVVGTRRPTPYGVNACERLAGDLAAAGLTVVSGMARGIDTTAHHAALERGGATIAVLGCGADVVYPSENRRLAARIVEQGLIVSEFPMGSTAFPQNFPIRNRIISGLSVGVLVVEGAQYSGSSITARLALDQGRDVFAVPGSIMSKMSWGPNLLIKQGAKLVQDVNDIVAELPPAVQRAVLDRAAAASSGGAQASLLEGASEPNPMAEIAAKLLGLLQVDEATGLDALLETAEGISPSEAIAALFDLELAGRIRQLPGKNFVKVW